MTIPTLVTERLILRPLAAGDLEDWVRFHADPATMRFIGGVQSRPVAWRSLCAMVGAWQIRGYSMLAVTDRQTGAWMGRIGPHCPEGWPGPEIGWGLLPAYAGRGYALEAATATMDYAVDVLGWDAVIHTIVPENRASIALAERLGATHQGPTTLPDPLGALVVHKWGQSAAAWRARRRA